MSPSNAKEAFRCDVRAILIYETVKKKKNFNALRLGRDTAKLSKYLLSLQNIVHAHCCLYELGRHCFLLHLGPDSVKCIAVT